MDPGLALEAEIDREETLRGRLPAELPALRAFVARLARGAGEGVDAEDLVQEVVARALRYARSFDPERALGPWLRRSAVRRLIDWRRQRQREPEKLIDPTSAPAPAREPGIDLREQVARLMRRLPEHEREVLLRFHRDDVPVREIARELGLSEGTVKSRLHRGRERLRSEPLEEEPR